MLWILNLFYALYLYWIVSGEGQVVNAKRYKFQVEIFHTSINHVFVGKSIGSEAGGVSIIKQLIFKNDHDHMFNVTNGDIIDVDTNSSSSSNVFIIDQYNVTKKVQSDFIPNRNTLVINSTVFMINVAGMKPDISYNEFDAQWFNSGLNSSTITMENYIKDCSWGKAVLSKSIGENRVVDLTRYVMPAVGKTEYSRLNYNTTLQCGFIEMYAFQEWAQRMYENIYGNRSLDNIQRRIVLLPYNNCPWYGAGAQGCMGRYCYVWIRGDRSRYLNTFFHEIGHTIGVQHSSNDAWEYGDCSCAMGCSGNLGCFNAPTSLRAGWSKLLNGYNYIAPGVWYLQRIPDMRDTHINTVSIDLKWNTTQWDGWNKTPFSRYYISLRSKTGYDKNLDLMFHNKLFIHYSESNDIYDYKRPFIKGVLSPGERYHDTARQMYIIFESLGYTGWQKMASVRLCRYTNKNAC